MLPLLCAALALAGVRASAADAPPPKLLPYETAEKAKDGSLVALMVARHRAYAPQISAILDVLDIKPGMRILDLGSGSGGYALEAARRLNGSGEVVAADINEELTAYTASQAAKRKLRVLRAVKVSGRADDPVFTRGRFDLILLFHTYNYLPDQVDTMFRLRDALRPGGRLAVLETAKGLYGLRDVTDYRGLAASLVEEPEGSPFTACLKPQDRALLAKLPRRGDPDLDPYPRMLLYRCLLDMQTSASFHRDFYDPVARAWKRPVEPLPEEAARVTDIAGFMVSEGTIERPVEAHSSIDFDLLSGLNTIILNQRFRPYLYAGGPPPYLPGSHPRFLRSWTGHTLRHGLPQIGLRLVSQSDAFPFEDLLVFSFAGPGAPEK